MNFLSFWLPAALITGFVTLALTLPLLRPALRYQGGPRPSFPLLAIVLALLLPLLALALYVPFGRPGLAPLPLAGRPAPSFDSTGEPPPAVKTALENLKRHLESAPEDGAAWELLARAELALGHAEAGAEAYGKVHALAPEDAALTAAYAAALTRAADGLVTEAARQLLAEALSKDPAEPQARFYMAEARAQAGDLAEALARLQDLKRDTPADASFRPLIEQRLTALARRLGVDPGKGAGAP